MTRLLAPESLGLLPRTVIEEIDANTLAIVINRKSRIIRTDGIRILANATKIKKAKPGTRVMLKTTAPVCSKTLQYLKEQGVGIIKY